MKIKIYLTILFNVMNSSETVNNAHIIKINMKINRETIINFQCREAQSDAILRN